MDGWITRFKVYNFVFNITHENNEFELYSDTFDEFSFVELKNELEEIVSTSDISPGAPKDDELGAPLLKAYRKLNLEKSNTDG